MSEKQCRLKKSMALLVCIYMLAAFIYTGIFIASHSSHICIGKDCSVCVQLHNAKSTLKLLGMALLFGRAIAFVYPSVLLSRSSFARYTIIPNTLIQLKVRLDN